jgi:hypothetical protein
VWNVLCWNIRGLNAFDKWDAIRNKIEECACSIVCIQETKHEHFDTLLGISLLDVLILMILFPRLEPLEAFSFCGAVLAFRPQ